MYAIEPNNEPLGEGNGWCVCPSSDATLWVVFFDNEPVETFPTEAEARAYVAKDGAK